MTTSNTEKKCCESDGLQYLSNPPQLKCRKCGRLWFTQDTLPLCGFPEKPVQEKHGPHTISSKDERWESGFKKALHLDATPDAEEWEKSFDKRFSWLFNYAEIDRDVVQDFDYEALKEFISALLQREREKAEKRGRESARHTGLFDQGKEFERSRLLEEIEKLKQKYRSFEGVGESTEIVNVRSATLDAVISIIKGEESKE